MEKHKYRLMRPCSKVVSQLSGGYPDSVNIALNRYLQLVSYTPDFLEEEWNLIFDACNGWLVDVDIDINALREALFIQIEESIYLNKLNQKWKVDTEEFVQKLKSISLPECLAVLYKIEKFWES